MKSESSNNKHLKKLIKSENLFPVVGIGASAGGLDAFKKLIKAIPLDSGLAYVLVQHLHPGYESQLAEILQKVTPIPVLTIEDDIFVEPNHIYVIPSNKVMVASDGVLQLAPRPEKSENERNLPIDLFFTSLAIIHQTHAIGVVLTGTGADGTLGLKAIKDHGGITFAQDEASSAYPDMPSSAIQAGVVDFVISPDEIPEKLLEVVKILNTPTTVEENLAIEDEEVFKQINALLHIRKGTDFTYYKQTTIRRRILRRMAINKNTHPVDYLQFLRDNPSEQDILYQDLLIPVTSFFRDSNIFENLCANVFPVLLKNKQVDEPIRIWIAGCSTGEEAYSMAICIKEFLGSHASMYVEERVQLFASDLSAPAILKARSGIYKKEEMSGISQERLSAFFTKTNGNYQINRQIRDMCVFTTHNFLKDPPFGKIDLLSCRNVLIYLEPYLQKKALTTFHYALKPKGFLLLGNSETTSGVPQLFNSIKKNEKLYVRKDVPSSFKHVVSPRAEINLKGTNDKPKTETMRSDFQKTADEILLSNYTPTGVVINEAMDIVQYRGSTSRYLEQSSGKPSHNLLVLAKNGLAFELRSLLHKTRKAKVAVKKENVPVEINGQLVNTSIEAVPLPNMIEPHYLILFHDTGGAGALDAPIKNSPSKSKSTSDAKDSRIKQLEQELTQTREDMRGITEDQDAANEELQSANEELLSGSEELQSLNEELETSKEELQSTNEELMVINQEMISLNEQFAAARNYAESIVANIREPLLVLDKSLRIKTANTSFYNTFKLNEKETEGHLIYNLGDKQWNIPELQILLEKILPEKSFFNDFEVTHTFPSVGRMIMLLNAREVINQNDSEKLILLSIEDITEQALARTKIEESEKRFTMMFMQSPFAFAVLKGKSMVITMANDSIKNIWDKGSDIEGKPLLKVLPELKNGNIPGLLTTVFETGNPYYGYEVLVPLKRKGKLEDVYFNFVFQPYLEADETISGVAVIAYEVTTEVSAQKRIEESEKKFRLMAELMPQKVWTCDAEGNKNYFNTTLFNYTGMSFEELKGEGWEKIIHSEDWTKNKKRWKECIRTGADYESENRMLRKDGKYLWHLTRAVALKNEDGKIKMWVGSKTEIHEQKEQKEELEKAVSKRTAELLEVNKKLLFESAENEKRSEELAKKNKELEAFAYVSSHDLQEPLRKIQTFADLIVENEKLSDNGQKYFRLIEDAAKRMRTLIEDLLSFSSLNTIDIKFESTDLNTIIDKVKFEYKEIIDEKQATFDTDKLYDANVIVYQFNQLMQNLISNALKFSKPDVPPHIVIKSTKVKGATIKHKDIDAEKKYCHISISDNGIGFEKEYYDKIFEVFQKLHGKEKYAGTGIGLAIVKKIVENHQGIITVTSEINKGTTFDIYIPADKK